MLIGIFIAVKGLVNNRLHVPQQVPEPVGIHSIRVRSQALSELTIAYGLLDFVRVVLHASSNCVALASINLQGSPATNAIAVGESLWPGAVPSYEKNVKHAQQGVIVIAYDPVQDQV